MQGAIDGVGEEKRDLLKVRMKECGLYVLALSEVRLPDQGVTTYDDGFVLIAAGVGSQGGTALLLSTSCGECMACCRLSVLRASQRSGGVLHVAT